MKALFSAVALLFALSVGIAAHAGIADLEGSKNWSPEPPCSLVADCDDGDDENDDYPKYRQCTAKDSNGRRYHFTASYQYPNKYIVAGAVNKCRSNSNNPSSCRSVGCRFVR